MKRVGQPEEKVIPHEEGVGVLLDEDREESPRPEPVEEDAPTAV